MKILLNPAVITWRSGQTNCQAQGPTPGPTQGQGKGQGQGQDMVWSCSGKVRSGQVRL